MDRKRAKELLPIIEAFANGEDIEYQLNSDWITIINDCSFSQVECEYRIKPKAKEGWVHPGRIHKHSGGLCETDGCIKVREVL